MRAKPGRGLGVLIALFLCSTIAEGTDRDASRPVSSQPANMVTGGVAHMRSVVAGGPATMRIRLTPVPSQGPGSYPPGSYISGQTLHATPGAFRAFFNIQLEDWDPAATGSPLLHVWQARIDGNGLLGANAVPPQSGCNIVPPTVSCPSNNAAGHAVCASAFAETGPECNSSPLRCEWGFSNRTRGDWVHAGDEPNVLADANLTSTSPLLFGLATVSGAGTADAGLLYYGATVVYDVPACALGQYTIPFGPAETFAADEQNPSNDIPILEMVSAIVEVAPQCDSNDDCDDVNACTTDTCLPDMTCQNTPIVCDDQNACTTDTCQPSTGCQYTPIPNCGADQTAITYQGSLENPSGSPVSDTCDFRFGLFATPTGGSGIGASPQTVSDVDVVNGSFTVLLDFGPGVFDGDARWLQIEVQCPGDANFVLLSPRMQLTPVPYALRALEGVGGTNALSVTPDGKVGIGTTTPTNPLEMASGAHCTAGGIWTDASDRAAKENFTPIDPADVLEQLAELDVTRWNYRVESPAIQHIGPVAQDFHALFGVGGDDKHLAALDTAGVALAAIQGLYEIVQEKDCEIDELKSQIEDLKELVRALAAEKAGSQ